MAPWCAGRCSLVVRSVPGSLNATIVMNLFTLLAVLAICLPLGELSITTLFVLVMLMDIGTSGFVYRDGKCFFSLFPPPPSSSHPPPFHPVLTRKTNRVLVFRALSHSLMHQSAMQA